MPSRTPTHYIYGNQMKTCTTTMSKQKPCGRHVYHKAPSRKLEGKEKLHQTKWRKQIFHVTQYPTKHLKHNVKRNQPKAARNIRMQKQRRMRYKVVKKQQNIYIHTYSKWNHKHGKR